MIGPVWFDADGDRCNLIETLHDKKIFVRAILQNGWIIEGVADLWTYVNGSRDKAAVTVVFEDMAHPYAFTQITFHLSSYHVCKIRPSSRSDSDYEYPGELKPELIPAANL